MVRILALLLAVGLYISYRMYKAFFERYKIYIVMPCVFIITQSFFIFKVIERVTGIYIPESVMGVTYILFGITVYLLIYFLIFDILYLFKIPFIRKYKNICVKVVVALALITFSYGYYHQLDTKIKYYDVIVDKPLKEPLKMAVISDIHIGSGMTVKRLDKYVNDINNMRPDIIFVVGDIIDSDLRAFTKDFKESLSKLYAPMGVYAVLGNHEYFSGDINDVISAIEESNMKLLKDDIIYFDDKEIYLIGRDSIRHSVSKGDERKSIKELSSNIDFSKPVVVLDHIPRSINEEKEIGIDLQFSGHTHGGQFFPVTLIVDRMYPISQGHLKEDNFNLIVTSGLGLWGPPMRVGSDSEILLVTLKKK